MQRHTSVQISYLIVFLSILTIMIQFVSYYFIASVYIIYIISCIVSLICCHILLEQSLTYEACFVYALLSIFISLIITVLTYFGNGHSLIPFAGTLVGITIINWLVPTLHCYFRNLFDYGMRIDCFNSFYRNSSIIFILFYFGIIFYAAFTKGAFPWAYPVTAENANFTPFWIISSQIEDYLYDLLPIRDIVIYLCSRILIFIPYGFYCTLLTRGHSRLLRFFFLLFLPVILEVSQYFFYVKRFDIDDMIYALIGGLLGALWFFITNKLYWAVSGKSFLGKDPNYRFSNGSLHF